MKKIILCGLLFLFATSVFADTVAPKVDLSAVALAKAEADGTDYFAKAKAARIAYLEFLRSGIDGQLKEMVADKVADSKEMPALVKSVEEFNEEQAKATETYKDIQVFLDLRIKELANLYAAPLLRNGAKYQERMSYLFAGLTGIDVQKIGEDFQWETFIILLVIFLVCLILTIVGFVWMGWDDGAPLVALIVIVDVTLLFVIIIGLIGI